MIDERCICGDLEPAHARIHCPVHGLFAGLTREQLRERAEAAEAELREKDTECAEWYSKALAAQQDREAVEAEVRQLREERAGGGDDYRLAMVSNARERMQVAEDRAESAEAEVRRLTDWKESAKDQIDRLSKSERRLTEGLRETKELLARILDYGAAGYAEHQARRSAWASRSASPSDGGGACGDVIQERDEALAAVEIAVALPASPAEVENARLTALLETTKEGLRRAVYLGEHLWQMIPQKVWRDTGGDDGQGHYEGNYRVEQVRDELAALALLAASSPPPGDTEGEQA